MQILLLLEKSATGHGLKKKGNRNMPRGEEICVDPVTIDYIGEEKTKKGKTQWIFESEQGVQFRTTSRSRGLNGRWSIGDTVWVYSTMNLSYPRNRSVYGVFETEEEARKASRKDSPKKSREEMRGGG